MMIILITNYSIPIFHSFLYFIILLSDQFHYKPNNGNNLVDICILITSSFIAIQSLSIDMFNAIVISIALGMLLLLEYYYYYYVFSLSTALTGYCIWMDAQRIGSSCLPFPHLDKQPPILLQRYSRI